jgi:hypothetical protein
MSNRKINGKSVTNLLQEMDKNMKTLYGQAVQLREMINTNEIGLDDLDRILEKVNVIKFVHQEYFSK